MNYVTAEGMALLKGEFSELWNDLRPKVADRLAWAATLGDRSENADYQYNKRLLREVDIRIKQLSDIFDSTSVLDRSSDGQRDNKVYFGAYVEIENDDGQIKHVHIVGHAETYNREGFISLSSPMAKGLMNLSIDDEAVINTPKGKVSWYVNKISYKPEAWFGPIPAPMFKFRSKFDDNKTTEIKSDEELAKIKQEYLRHLAGED